MLLDNDAMLSLSRAVISLISKITMFLAFSILIYSPVIATNPSISPTESPIFSGCTSLSHLDLIFILDSSGSVGYTNWQAELDFAKSIVNSSLPTDTNIGCINFSGCSSTFDFDQCKNANKLKKMFGLTDYGIPNNQQAVYDRFASMGKDDFTGGYTWTNEALQMALNEFRGNSSIDRNQMIILLTDGAPYPYLAHPDGLPLHEPCIVGYPTANDIYISNTLQQLRDDNVSIIVVNVAIHTAEYLIDKYIKCLVDDVDDHFFNVTSFSALASLASVISDIVCAEETYSPSSTPTPSSIGIPAHAPDFCFIEENHIGDIVVLTWSETNSNAVESYRIYKNDQEFQTIPCCTTELRLNTFSHGSTTSYSVSAVLQFTPPIESPKTNCLPYHTPSTTVDIALKNCTQLIVTSSIEPIHRPPLSVQLNLDDPPLNDGKFIWTDDDNTYVIAWYDDYDIGRWTLYDVKHDELYLAPLSLSTLSVPIPSSQSNTIEMIEWILWPPNISSRFGKYTLGIQCIHIPAPPTPAPIPILYDPCSFPDDIVHDWHLDHLRTWNQCYYATYSDGTTKSDLDNLCLNQIESKYGTKPTDLEDVYIFVGAVEKTTSHAYVGAYGHVEILQAPTTSVVQAQQITYKNKYPKKTWWYYVDNLAFGFSDIERINLAQDGCDNWNTSSNNKLCWHLINKRTGGWRAGNKINLNLNGDISKILYYKQCKTEDICQLPAEVGSCDPTKTPTEHPSKYATTYPTKTPTVYPSKYPTKLPTKSASINPTISSQSPNTYPTKHETSQKWFYNAISQKCEEFSYSGCGGNGNNFETPAECRSQCQGKGKGKGNGAIAKVMTNGDRSHDNHNVEIEDTKSTETHGILSIVIIFSTVILVVFVCGVHQNVLKRRAIKIVQQLSQKQTETETSSVDQNEIDGIESSGIQKETEMI